MCGRGSDVVGAPFDSIYQYFCRPTTTWTVNIYEWTGLTYSEAVRKTETRNEWRVIPPTLAWRTEHDDDDDNQYFHDRRQI